MNQFRKLRACTETEREQCGSIRDAATDVPIGSFLANSALADGLRQRSPLVLPTLPLIV